MGLAAGQARLLTITGRKSDCEFESMRLSHQKIALARELADLSNEYQTSLNKTKLVYDFYGTGDTNTPLTYSTLMAPSMLNNYAPTLITDSMGRVVLDSSYAAAAAAAGIPQEGLGSLPSEVVRNQFVQAMASPTSSIITQDMANKITSLPYNQEIGFGGGATVATLTQDVTFNELCTLLSESNATVDLMIAQNMLSGNRAEMQLNLVGELPKGYVSNYYANMCEVNNTLSFDLGDILNGDLDISYWTKKRKGSGPEPNMVGAIQASMLNALDSAHEILSSYLDLGNGSTAMALEYAYENTKNLFSNLNNYYTNVGSADVNTAQNYMGLVSHGYKRSSTGHWWNQSCINVNNMFKAYLTHFADAMNGVGAVDSNGNEIYVVGNTLGSSKLVDSTTMFTIKTGVEVSSDDLAVATFYDTLLNQICMNGWVENNQINDPEYLQQMLQNGMLYISKTKDDGYYYQGNYSIDTYIKEIADEQFIAEAEAKYNTEKAKLNAKEETLDMKMKNLDTEISSLTTEYDTVKNTITKNIEKTFKRYSA